MWFGNKVAAFEVLNPLTELGANPINNNSSQQLKNGGISQVQSWGEAKTYDLTAHGTADQIGIYKDFRQGLYGDDLIHFNLQHAEDRNMFPPNWAAPGSLVRLGDWPDLVNTQQGAPGFAPTAGLTSNPTSNPNLLPLYTATHVLGFAEASLPPYKKTTFLIPPTKTLRIGHTGSVSGGGAWAVRPINLDGTYAAIVALTPLTAAGSSRFNATFSGATYRGVEVFLYNTNAVGSSTVATIVTVCMMAQLYVTAAGAPAAQATFMSGKGVSGLQWTSTLQETITFDRPSHTNRFEVSGTLSEVEQWLRPA